MGESGQGKSTGKSPTAPASEPPIDEVDAGWGDALDAGWDDEFEESKASPQASLTSKVKATPPGEATAVRSPVAAGGAVSPVPGKVERSASPSRSATPAPASSRAGATRNAASSKPSTVAKTGAGGRSATPAPASVRRLDVEAAKQQRELSVSRGKPAAPSSLKSRPSAPSPPSVRKSTPAVGSSPKLSAGEPHRSKPSEVNAPPRASSVPSASTSSASPLTARSKKPKTVDAAAQQQADGAVLGALQAITSQHATALQKQSIRSDLDAAALEPSSVGSASDAEASLLSHTPDLAAFAVSTPSSAAVEDEPSEASPMRGDPASLQPSVADMDVIRAVQAARRGTRSRALLAAAAVVVLGAGAGFGIYSRESPSVQRKVDPAPGAVAAKPREKPASVAAAPVPGIADSGKEPPRAAPEDPNANESARDFAAAFAQSPKGDAKSHAEVVVRVSPLGAHIYDGPKLLAQTATKVQLEPGATRTLMVHLQGYHSRKVLVDGSSTSVNIVMRPADGSAATQPAPAKPDESHPGRSFIVQSQQQRAEPKTAAPPKQAESEEPAPGDILPPL